MQPLEVRPKSNTCKLAQALLVLDECACHGITVSVLLELVKHVFQLQICVKYATIPLPASDGGTAQIPLEGVPCPSCSETAGPVSPVRKIPGERTVPRGQMGRWPR